SLPLRLALTASFALATMALPYVRHVNNHELLLAVAAALFLNLARLPRDLQAGRTPWLRLLGLGLLAGLGHAIDLGAGPVGYGGTRRLALPAAGSRRRLRPGGPAAGRRPSRRQLRGRWHAEAGQRGAGVSPVARQRLQRPEHDRRLGRPRCRRTRPVRGRTA